MPGGLAYAVPLVVKLLHELPVVATCKALVNMSAKPAGVVRDGAFCDTNAPSDFDPWQVFNEKFCNPLTRADLRARFPGD